MSLKLSDTRVYEPQIRARLGTTTHLCEVVVLKLRTVFTWSAAQVRAPSDLGWHGPDQRTWGSTDPLGSYLRLIDFVYHSTVGLRVIKKKKKDPLSATPGLGGHATPGPVGSWWRVGPNSPPPQVVAVPLPTDHHPRSVALSLQLPVPSCAHSSPNSPPPQVNLLTAVERKTVKARLWPWLSDNSP